MDQKKIGSFIAECRKEHNLTQVELAQKLGVTDRSVSNWENGKNMPDLSLFKPLCDELGITINELMSGERIEEECYQKKLEENIVNTIAYSTQKKTCPIRIPVLLVAGGLLVLFSALLLFPKESSWCSVSSFLGMVVFAVGIALLPQALKKGKRILIGMCALLVTQGSMLLLDYMCVITFHHIPLYRLQTTTKGEVIWYQAPFYSVFRIHANTANAYDIVDTKKEYDINTVPFSPFNHEQSGIDAIDQYKSLYVGDNSNTANLLQALPLSEYGFVFQIDDAKCGLIVNYHVTDWYIQEEQYLQKALLYNSVTAFLLIDNLNYIQYNFTGESYTITRDQVESTYPDYDSIKENGDIQKENFYRLLEEKMNDDAFVERVFLTMFHEPNQEAA